VILLFNQINNDAVIKELFTAAGFTYGPLLGMFAFGVLTKRSFKDKHIVFISLLSIGITALYYYLLPKLVDGFIPGFEVIIVNGLITFAALFVDSLAFKRK
jgi:SSS family solute:Na+ symporter